jgi:hypothetical protein
MYKMKRFYRTLFIILGGLSFILTFDFCLQMPLLTGILPPTGSFPIHIFLASITASITASLLWIGFTGELGAIELFLNHTITLSMSLWFLGLAGISTLGALGTVHLVWRAREESENAELLRLLKDHHYLFVLYYVVAAAIALLLAYICYAMNLQASNGVQGMRGMLATGLVLLIAIGLDGSALVSNRYWRKAVLYARTGRVPNVQE